MIDYEGLKEKLRKKGFDVDRVTDPAGTPIDEKIKPLVAVLNLLDYSSYNSCEGHPLYQTKERIWTNDLSKGHAKIIEEDENHFVLVYQGFKYVHDESPSVELTLTPEQKSRLELLLQNYNSKNGIKWILDNLSGLNHYDLKVRPVFPLEEMQANIIKISEFILNSHKLELDENLFL